VSAGPNPTGGADRNSGIRDHGAGQRVVKHSADSGRMGGRGRRTQDSGRAPSQRRSVSSPDSDLSRPDLPADVDASELDREVRQELLTLPKGLADLVGSHLVMVARVLDEDPQLALAHARFARSKAGRVPSVREAAGLAAYHAAEWSEALAELRAARRLGGGPGRLAVLADCERALGRPERALEIARSPEARELGTDEAVELRIVAAGARRDLGQFDAAVVALQGPDLDTAGEEPWRARLRYAYADNLLAAGREQDAIRWFLAAVEADVDDATDAAERAVELSERPESE
jgi:tetratricopeptide (TPR) repeat protein